MALLTVYTTPIDWSPDTDYINSAQGIHYLAWQIGVSENLGTASWLIYPVIDSPEPLENLLPNEEDYISREFIKDVGSQGERRVSLPDKSVDALQADFLAEVDTVIEAIGNGSR